MDLILHKAGLRKLAEQYFEDHPQERDGVMKAYYAYHAGHFRTDPGAHNFTNGSRECCCVWCGRSREMVRHDDLPAQCQQRPPLEEIVDVILEEERKAFLLYEKAKTEVPKLVAKMGMSEETMKFLWETHGFDRETVESVINGANPP